MSQYKHLDVVSIQYPFPATADNVVPVTIVDCQAIEAKPDAVPLLVNVAPAGITKSSPLSPNVRVVPDLGDILFTFISLITQLTPNSCIVSFQLYLYLHHRVIPIPA
jgi:predicted secreted protein